MEKAGKSLDESMKKAKEQTGRAMEKAGESLKEAGEKNARKRKSRAEAMKADQETGVRPPRLPRRLESQTAGCSLRELNDYKSEV